MTTTTPTLNNTTRSPLFDHTPGSPSSRRQSSHSQQFPVSLNRHLSEPNIRSMAAHDPLHDPLSNATKGRHQQRRRGNGSVSPSPSSASDSADRRPSSAGPTASSGWESQVDILADSLQGKMTMTSTQDLPPIMSGDQNTSPVDRYAPVSAIPFSEHGYADTRPRSSDFMGADPVLHPETAHARLHSPASSLVPVSRSVASEDEYDTMPPDPSVNKTYSFVSLPGNAVRKRPRRRYDETERLYQCSWSGCTKSYGTLNHLNAHIVMQRHGNKRTPAEFKELRKQWRKTKKDESERMVPLERPDALRSEPTLQYPPQPYERQPMSVSYGGRQHLYGPGIPGPEMDHQLASGETAGRYPPSAETPSMRHQPLQQQSYGYPMSGSGHSLYSVVPHAPISPSWPKQATQYEGTTPPQHGSTFGHAHHLPAQAMYDYERERQGYSWTPSSIPHPPPSSRSMPSYELSPPYTQPQAPSQRVNTLPPDSTLLTPLPGYQPSTDEPQYEEEYDNK